MSVYPEETYSKMVYSIESGREVLPSLHSSETASVPASDSASVSSVGCSAPVDAMETEVDLYHNQGYRLCRPFIWLMRLGGMFFMRTSAIQFSHKGHAGQQIFVKGRLLDEALVSKWVNLERVSKVWSLFVLLINAVYAGKFLYSVVFGLRQLHFSQRDLGSIVAHCSFAISIILVIITQLIFLRNCLHSAGLFEFFCTWRDLHYRCAVHDDSCMNFTKCFSFRRNIICVIAGIHLVLYVFSLAIGPTFLTSQSYQQLHWRVTEGFDSNNQALMALNFIGGSLVTIIGVVPPYFFYMIAELLTVDFEHLAHDLEAAVKSPKKTGRNIEWFRARHNALCTLVQMADDIFSPWVLLMLSCMVAQVLCNVYVTYAESAKWTFVTAATAAFWFATFFFQAFIVLRAGSKLSEAAHSPLSHVHQIDQSTLDVPTMLQIQTFLNRLTSTKIGFTAWKMFTIDHEAVLAVAAAYITHQILIFEIQLDLQLEDRIEECTHIRQNRLDENPASLLEGMNLLLNHTQ